MFTQNCYIKKNTKYLRDRLSSFGYKLNHGKAWGEYLACFKIKDTEECRFVATPEYDLKNMPDFKNAVDCGTNEELFLAIAALRDDSNKNQWFTDGANWCFHDLDKEADWLINKSWRKATVEKLIEHFKE
jgi:hypothetical protein